MELGVSIATVAYRWMASLFATPSFVGSLLTAGVTVAGFYYANRQIRNASLQIEQAAERHNEEMTWRRSEFVRKLLSDMANDEKVSLIYRVLDWRDGPALIPKDLQIFFEEDKSGNHHSSKILNIEWSVFVESISVIKNDGWTDPIPYTYRTCFDSFLSFIQQTVTDLRSAKIDEIMYADLTFYCHRIINPLNNLRKPDEIASEKFKDYIVEYYNDETYNYILRCSKYYQGVFIDNDVSLDRASAVISDDMESAPSFESK
ncbi:hypothetical protein [Sphingomonas sp.]|uniref:hypothetical protein n=1 Tax=Sphingomonas sp. TaxID=28214 RepID=UPI0025CF932B|nr:hypothetical protein [Sphingomonas sp.]